MNRRRALGAVVAAIALAGGLGVYLWYRPRWTKPPSITVIAAVGDPRIPVVREAVDYWNRTFAELGTPFRLGDVALAVGMIPEADVLALASIGSLVLPASIQQYPGDLLVILSSASFISFTAVRGRRAVVAIKSADLPPLTFPNVLRNVIAHELGHAIGLAHDADPTLLMCGRPAPCRPDIYRSDMARFFPLSPDEKARLLALYPADWTGR